MREKYTGLLRAENSREIKARGGRAFLVCGKRPWKCGKLGAKMVLTYVDLWCIIRGVNKLKGVYNEKIYNHGRG